MILLVTIALQQEMIKVTITYRLQPFYEITSEKKTVESKLFFILPSSYFGIPRITRQQ